MNSAAKEQLPISKGTDGKAVGHKPGSNALNAHPTITPKASFI